MNGNESESNFEVDRYLPPTNPRNYFDHDHFLSKKYGTGPPKSIQKEIEGMARLFNSVEAELDDNVRKKLRDSVKEQVKSLRGLEDEVIQFESEKDDSDEDAEFHRSK